MVICLVIVSKCCPLSNWSCQISIYVSDPPRPIMFCDFYSYYFELIRGHTTANYLLRISISYSPHPLLTDFNALEMLNRGGRGHKKQLCMYIRFFFIGLNWNFRWEISFCLVNWFLKYLMHFEVLNRLVRKYNIVYHLLQGVLTANSSEWNFVAKFGSSLVQWQFLTDTIMYFKIKTKPSYVLVSRTKLSSLTINSLLDIVRSCNQGNV